MMAEPRLDDVIHGLVRLRVCAFLSRLEEAEFRILREDLEVSESVLSKHLKQLERAGYVALDKEHRGGRRTTLLSLTRAGQSAFASHVAALRSLAGDD